MNKMISFFLVALFSAQAMASEVAVLDFRAALLQSKAGQEAAKQNNDNQNSKDT